MKKYEIMFIVKATMEADAIKASAAEMQKLITDNNGKVVEFKEMGEKKLAYPINKQVRGNYYVFNVEATAAAVNEFDRKAKIDENILRHIVIREEE